MKFRLPGRKAGAQNSVVETVPSPQASSDFVRDEEKRGDLHSPDVASIEANAIEANARLPEKYVGTEADRRDMIVMGKTQVLRRNFKFMTMAGFASTVMCTWEFLLPLYTFVLYDGGTALLFWGFVAIIPGIMLVYMSLAELSSMFPTAGGQYHWVSEIAPPRYQKSISYFVGWLTAIGWQVYMTGVCFTAGTIIQGLIKLNMGDAYDFQRYHGTLLTIACMVVGIVTNTLLSQRLPLIEGIVLILHVVGFFAIIIPLWVLAPRGNTHDVLFNFTNNGGWSSTGLSSMIGLATPFGVCVGYDCVVHMSEDTRDAGMTTPKALVWAVGPNLILGFLMGVTLIFTMGDIDNLLNTPTRQPFIQQFYNATGSKGGTTVMVMIVVVMLIASTMSELATASRQLWSFARDRGLPFSSWLTHVSPSSNIPRRAVSVSFVFVSALACINIGSTFALSAIMSLGLTAVATSYMVTLLVLIHRRLRGPPLPPRRWSLGRWGLPINIVALVFLIPLWFFSYWPLVTPVTATTINWASTMFGALLIFMWLWYFVRGRKEYVGPVTLVKRTSDMYGPEELDTSR